MLERKILTAKRLDLDAAKNRIKKAKSLESQNNAEQDLKLAEEKFNKQVEITKLLLEGISSAQTNHVRCLSEFVDSQIKYYTDCHQQMIELQMELAQLSNQPNTINQQSSNIQSNGKAQFISNESNNTRQQNGKLMKQQMNGQIFKANDLVSPSDEQPINLPEHKKRARVLYDYTAQNNGELNLAINEIIIINLDDIEDSDFLLAERGLERGKVPISYLEILS